MGFKGALINTLLVALFFIALISIANNLATNNDMSLPFSDTPQINNTFNTIDDSLKDFGGERGKAEDATNLLRKDEPRLISDLGIFGIIKVAVTIPFFIVETLTSMLDLIIVGLSIPPVVMYTFIGIISVVVIGVIVSFIRRGI